MKIVFDSEDDSHVHIEVEIDPYTLILCAISDRGYIFKDLKDATDDLLEIYPNDSLRTILKEKVEVYIL